MRWVDRATSAPTHSAGRDRSQRAGTRRGGLGQVVVGWDRSWWARTGRGGLVQAISAVLLDVWGGVSGGRLGCAARQDVSVPGCWPGQAFTPETGRPAAAGADTSCRAARPSLQLHPISLRPADPARIGRHRGGPHRRLLRLGGARAGGDGIGSQLRDLGHRSGVLGQVVPCPRSRYLCEVAADPAAGRSPETGRRGRGPGQEHWPRPGTGHGGRGPRQDVVAGARDRTWWGGWDRTWWEGPWHCVSPPTASCLRSPDPGRASDQDAADRPSAPSLRPGRSDHRRGSSAHGEPRDPVDPVAVDDGGLSVGLPFRAGVCSDGWHEEAHQRTW